ncbi:MAG: T9SS type B sorting domain-containing protein, partial [Bacteroidales bacterium]|nr:T9SS type B sorting domain-containing protein [Bacteroidales bacterium]
PYTYNWSNGDNGQNISGLVSGTYYLTVTDNNSCVANSTIYVGMQGSSVVYITETQAILCHGDENAILTTEVINGIEPIEYQWSNNTNSQTIDNLGTGIYSVTATDAWGCSGVQSQMVSQPQNILINILATEVNCFGGSDGTASASISGGTEPYNYLWSNNSPEAIITNLNADEYYLTITDAHNCQKVESVIINQPELPITVDMQIEHISCYGDSDGAVSLAVYGGVEPYQYEWSFENYSTNQMDINNLYEGIYMLTITDANNCTKDTLAIISQPEPLSATYLTQQPSCIGYWDGYIEINAIGGTEPYQYAWADQVSSLEFISGLVEGEYIITITDYRNCLVEIGSIILTDIQKDCIKIPNAFTPNDDGVNDSWIIEHIEMFPTAYIQVFNRWGQEIYAARGSEKPWDGTYKGRPVPTGPYIYVINLFNSEKIKTGTVTVVR